MTLLDPGDEVLVPDPGWPNYRAQIHVLGGSPVAYPVDLRGGSIDASADRGARSASGRRSSSSTRPNNPSGAVYDARALAAVAEVCARHDLWVISDECYDELTFDVEHVSIAAVAPSERVITIFSFSKTYAMTGWRIGYVVAPRSFADEVLKAQEPVHANASSVSQKAAEAALAGDQSPRRRDARRLPQPQGMALEILDGAGVDYVMPQGAFYVMVDVSALGSSMDAAAHPARVRPRVGRPGRRVRRARGGLGARLPVCIRRSAERGPRPHRRAASLMTKGT